MRNFFKMPCHRPLRQRYTPLIQLYTDILLQIRSLVKNYIEHCSVANCIKKSKKKFLNFHFNFEISSVFYSAIYKWYISWYWLCCNRYISIFLDRKTQFIAFICSIQKKNWDCLYFGQFKLVQFDAINFHIPNLPNLLFIIEKK